MMTKNMNVSQKFSPYFPIMTFLMKINPSVAPYLSTEFIKTMDNYFFVQVSDTWAVKEQFVFCGRM
jgi:hypothetical protein